MEQVAVQNAKRNPNVVHFLLGKVMQITKGRADPNIVLNMIHEKLEEN
jgi:aspartyl-tRNA(Asn)/glutamyl-tRNA(Gln) amidotransferase subunit B